MISKKGGRIIINLSTPEIKNLPESISKDGEEIHQESIIQNFLGSIIKQQANEVSYETHIVLFNKHTQREWGYLTFYLERKEDTYYLPHIKTITVNNDSDNKIDEIIKERIVTEYPSINANQIEQIFQNDNELFVFINDMSLNSITSDNQRWFISNELNEPYINETCRNLMKFETKIYNELSDVRVTYYSSGNAYICKLNGNQYENVIKTGESIINENQPFIEHEIIGKTYIFSIEPLNNNNQIRKYVYPKNHPETHLLDKINKETYETLKNTSFIVFNENNNKMISLKSRNLFIEL